MSKIGKWSTTAGNNNATPPDGWPEGQAPSTINDCAREMMAAIKTYANDAEFFDTGNTPSYLTATTFSLGSSDATNFHVGRRVKLFDATTLYGTIESVSSTFVSVRLDSGALTASLSSVAIGVIRADNTSLPQNAFNHQNVIRNSGLDLWQRGNSFSAVAGDTFFADRFALRLGGGAITIQRSERSETASNVPSLAVCGQLLTAAMKFTVGTTVPSMTANAYCIVQQAVEGYDWRKIAHKPNHLSLYVNTNRSGIYSIALRSFSFSASYVTEMTVDTVNAWTKFNFKIPEAPFGPNWNYSDQVGVRVSIALTGGVNFQAASLNEWVTNSSNFISPSQVNFMATAGNAISIAGIKLEEGLCGTPLDIVPYVVEEAAAKRYFQVLPDGFSAGETFAVGQGKGNGFAQFVIQLPQEMRRPPVVTLPSADNFLVTSPDGTFNVTASAVVVLGFTTRFLFLGVNSVGGAGIAAGDAVMLNMLSNGPAALIQLDTDMI